MPRVKYPSVRIDQVVGLDEVIPSFDLYGVRLSSRTGGTYDLRSRQGYHPRPTSRRPS